MKTNPVAYIIRDLLLDIGKMLLVVAASFPADGTNSVEAHLQNNLTTGEWSFSVDAAGHQTDERSLARKRAKLLKTLENRHDLADARKVDDGKEDILTNVHVRDGQQVSPNQQDDAEAYASAVTLLQEQTAQWSVEHPDEPLDDEDDVDEDDLTCLLNAVI